MSGATCLVRRRQLTNWLLWDGLRRVALCHGALCALLGENAAERGAALGADGGGHGGRRERGGDKKINK